MNNDEGQKELRSLPLTVQETIAEITMCTIVEIKKLEERGEGFRAKELLEALKKIENSLCRKGELYLCLEQTRSLLKTINPAIRLKEPTKPS